MTGIEPRFGMSEHDPWSWIRILGELPARKAQFLGAETGNLLPLAVDSVVQAVYRMDLWPEVRSAILQVSPRQYRWTVLGSPLRQDLAEAMPFDDFDILFQPARVSGPFDMRRIWAEMWGSLYEPLVRCGLSLYVAERGAYAIRTQQGLWRQTYRRGWPLIRAVPDPSPHASGGACLVIAASLTEEWFEDLPFTENSVLGRIPPDLRPVITVEWHEKDDILPLAASPEIGLQSALRVTPQ